MPKRQRERVAGLARQVGDFHDRIGVLLNQGGTSRVGLRKILSQIREDPALFLEGNDRDAHLALFESLCSTIKLRLVDGTDFDWEFCNPMKLWQKVLAASPMLQSAYADAAARVPAGEPWQLIISFDEYTPGSRRRPETKRKSMNTMFNFATVGHKVLSMERSWLTPVTLRSSIISKVEGGWSALLRKLLDLMLFSESGLMVAGWPTCLHGQPYLVKGALATFMTDGEGFAKALQWRGAACIKPCFRHANVLKRGCVLSASLGDDFCEITCSDRNRFKLTQLHHLYDDVDSLIEAQRLRHEGTLPLATINQLKYAGGLDVTASGLLACPKFRAHCNPVSLTYYDWAHTMLQDGVFTNEFSNFLRCCEANVGLNARWWESKLKDGWCFPSLGRYKKAGLHRLFNEYRMPSGENISNVRGAMSEMLGIYALVRHLVETEDAIRDNDTIALARDSFDACCDIMDVFLDAKYRRLDLVSAAAKLRSATTHYFERTKIAHGDSLKPKAHWLYDIADSMQNHSKLEILLDAFVLERNHLHTKRIASHMKNTASFERSVLSILVHDQLNSIREESDHMLHDHVETIGPNATLAKRMTAFGLRFVVGEPVIRGDSIGVVSACARDGAVFSLVVHVLDSPERFTQNSLRASISSSSRELWDIREVSMVLAWYDGGGDKLIVLKSK